MSQKVVTEREGLELDGPVLILKGPNTPKIEKVRRLGLVGFYVKERSVTFFWSDKGATWRPV
jgi:hypothetical protein